MVLSVHLLTGAAIGSKFKNYWVILILALLSHFALDAIPHWEYAVQLIGASGNEFLTATVKALLDILIGVSAVGWLLKSSRLARPAFWGAFFALLPDGLIFTYALTQVFFGWRLDLLNYPVTLHDSLHFADETNFLLWRVAAETLVAALAVFILWRTRLATRQHK